MNRAGTLSPISPKAWSFRENSKSVLSLFDVFIIFAPTWGIYFFLNCDRMVRNVKRRYYFIHVQIEDDTYLQIQAVLCAGLCMFIFNNMIKKLIENYPMLCTTVQYCTTYLCIPITLACCPCQTCPVGQALSLDEAWSQGNKVLKCIWW